MESLLVQTTNRKCYMVYKILSRWPWMTFKLIHLVHAFSNAILRTTVQQLTRRQLTCCVARSLCHSAASCFNLDWFVSELFLVHPYSQPEEYCMRVGSIDVQQMIIAILRPAVYLMSAVQSASFECACYWPLTESVLYCASSYRCAGSRHDRVEIKSAAVN